MRLRSIPQAIWDAIPAEALIVVAAVVAAFEARIAPCGSPPESGARATVVRKTEAALAASRGANAFETRGPPRLEEDDEGVEPRNDAAERALHHSVRRRKTSFETDSPAGSW
ncbi:hypothetical protein [Paludisphaera mucosa]|uniref:Uncharacterized protein n=1 Tax=Paludisphaera mucosa TaxID=3030827 RepID=A0ABT6FLB0_9BACT|nr:hypothetical protein [Paludisphaera mucosa]MDG3008363.1 hypothetical protein [Paludisphaera mucosa]